MKDWVLSFVAATAIVGVVIWTARVFVQLYMGA